MRSNHVARVLIFESVCWTRFDLEYAKSRSSRERDRRTIGALCSRGVPASSWEQSPSHHTDRTCVRQKSTISFPLYHPFPILLSPSFSVLHCSFAPFHRTPATRSPSSSFFLCTFAHVPGDPTMNACLRAHQYTRGFVNRVYLDHTCIQNLNEWLYHI